MEKKFNTLAKALKLLELEIEGTFGEGLTLRDFVKYDCGSIKHLNKESKEGWEVYVVIREHGTFTHLSYGAAKTTWDQWNDSKYIIKIWKNVADKNYYIERIRP